MLIKSIWSSIAAFGKKGKKVGKGAVNRKNYFEVRCTLNKAECNANAQIISESDYRWLNLEENHTSRDAL